MLKTSETTLIIQPDGSNTLPITVNLNDYNALDHGYAVTIHKSQGATVDKSYLYATKTMDQHLIYVAATRHREQFKAYYCGGDEDNESIQYSVRDTKKEITGDFEYAYSERRGKVHKAHKKLRYY